MIARRRWLFAAVLLASGCVKARSTLAPAGPAARTLAELGWPLLIGFTGVSAIMWGLLVWVATRRTGTFAGHAPLHGKGGIGWVVIGGFVVPGIAFTAAYVATLGAMSAFPLDHARPSHPQIRVVGRQWWWEVEYLMGDLPQHFKTANEIHVPTDRPIEIELASADVIHSFWVPRLHGKVDLVPGYPNHIRIRAPIVGTYAGSCAEFCGLQHARMRMVVVADPPEVFQRWLEQQRRPAAIAAIADDSPAARGARVFKSAACPVCHTIDGTRATASVGPDLSHIGSRTTLAAGSLPKDLATLHAWIMNAPALKPGTRMPALTQLGGPDLHDLVAYLEALR